jgi:acetyl-CoA acetyltransferase
VSSDAAIVGLGVTELGKVYGRSPGSLAAQAVELALIDAGITPGELDGLLINNGLGQDIVDLTLAEALNLGSLNLLSSVHAYGATAGILVAQAAQAIAAGVADVVACVFATTPLQPARPAGAAWGATSGGGEVVPGLLGWRLASGVTNPNVLYALCARTHMERYGTTSEQLAAIAVAQRAWAAGNPLAAMRTPMTIADHQASRFIAEPLHLLDCCLVSNGAIAVVVASAERAADLRQPPVHVWGWGQSHRRRDLGAGSDWGVVTPAVRSGRDAMRMAGVAVRDVDICELYDCYTYTVLVTLEDYGFCEKGEGGAFVADGRLGPGGQLACNTGGGQLSGYYMWGMTPLSEAVIQARGGGGERQAPRNEVILVSGNGGILEHHATLVLSPLARSRRG